VLVFQKFFSAVVGLFQPFEIPVTHPSAHRFAVAGDEDAIACGEVVIHICPKPGAEFVAKNFDEHGFASCRAEVACLEKVNMGHVHRTVGLFRTTRTVHFGKGPVFVRKWPLERTTRTKLSAAHRVDHQLHVVGVGIGGDPVAKVEDMRAIFEGVHDVAGFAHKVVTTRNHMS